MIRWPLLLEFLRPLLCCVCGGAPLLLRLLLVESPTSSSSTKGSSDRWHLAELAGFRYAYVATGYETAAVTTRSIKKITGTTAGK